MQLEQYTADALCHAMSIGPFVDPTWGSNTIAIRLLLEPSFHPEACITIRQSGGVAFLSATVLAEMLWRQVCPCRLPAFHDEGELTTPQFTRLAHYHHEAVTDPSVPRAVCLDGMSMDCAWHTTNGQKQLHSQVLGDVLRVFVTEMIDQAWHTCTNEAVRNGLAECARYVGGNYPMTPATQLPTLFRLGVFGSPDDIDDYFRIVNAAQREA